MSAGFAEAAGAVVDDVPMLKAGFSPGTMIVMVESVVTADFVAIFAFDRGTSSVTNKTGRGSSKRWTPFVLITISPPKSPSKSHLTCRRRPWLAVVAPILLLEAPIESLSVHRPLRMAEDPTFSMEPTTDDETAAADSAAAPSTSEQESDNKSALQDNIERKGKNAYYFAHAHKSTGPQWDGKPEPKLLSRQESQHTPKTPAFDYSKSNITQYAFLNEDKCVKLYIDLEGVGEKCSDEDIVLDYTNMSMSLVVYNYKEDEPLCLSFGKLTASIDNATCKKKKDKLIVTLTKSEPGEWHTINDKGPADHEVV